MYMTFLAGSPCANTVSFAPNLTTFLPRPVESRKNFRSKPSFLEFPFLTPFGIFAETRLAAEDNIDQTSPTADRKTVQYCTASLPRDFPQVSAFVSNPTRNPDPSLHSLTTQ